MNVPDDLLYSADHEWVREEDGGRVRVGVTDYAQDALGDVVFVELPSTGSAIEAGGVLGEVESTKSVSELFAPIAGQVLDVNADLEASPEKINEDPYGDGWICVIHPSGPSSLNSLMDADAYRALIGS